mmetsp:Transcript_23322/g.43830  ORF Transcript_23322/g.43830 Transcript_23322/m.43830 type:complete len:296 (-) Transcript_23322:56-943(-)
MGNAPPVADERIQKTQERMQLTKRDIAGFWKVFRKFDREHEGTITMETFFIDICQEERNLFGDAIFDLIDTEDTACIEFGEFVQGVCTFAMFTVTDVLRFSFFIFDKDKNGYIDKDELDLFVNTLHTGGMGANIMQALKAIDFNGDGKFDFMEFSALHEKFPTVLYPAFRLQQQMCSNIMGAQWWHRKKAFMQNAKEDELRELEKQRRIEEKRAHKARNQQIRAEMGLGNYYSFAKKNRMKRDYLERMQPLAEVYLDADNQVQIKYPDPIKKMGDEQFQENDDDEEDGNKGSRAQ